MVFKPWLRQNGAQGVINKLGSSGLIYTELWRSLIFYFRVKFRQPTKSGFRRSLIFDASGRPKCALSDRNIVGVEEQSFPRRTGCGPISIFCLYYPRPVDSKFTWTPWITMSGMPFWTACHKSHAKPKTINDRWSSNSRKRCRWSGSGTACVSDNTMSRLVSRGPNIPTPNIQSWEGPVYLYQIWSGIMTFISLPMLFWNLDKLLRLETTAP